MQEDLTAAVEALTHRKVAAFMSVNHIAPDVAAEVFVLDEPLAEQPRRQRGRYRPRAIAVTRGLSWSAGTTRGR